MNKIINTSFLGFFCVIACLTQMSSIAAPPLQSSLQLAENGAKELRTEIWTETVPNGNVLRDIYQIHVHDLNAAAKELQGDSRLSSSTKWAVELMDLYERHMLPESVGSFMKDAISTREKLENFAGKDTVRAIDLSLSPVPILRQVHSTKRSTTVRPNQGDFNPRYVPGGSPES